MHFGLISDEYCAPYPTTRGTAINTWSIMISLLQAGHQVTVFIISNESPERYEEIATTGVVVKTVPYGNRRPYWTYDVLGTPREIFKPDLETYYGWVSLAPAMKKVLEEVRPDAILAFTLHALAATHLVNTCPRMAVFVDLEHLVAHYRWLATPPVPVRSFIKASLRRFAYSKQPKFMSQLLSDCQSVVDFAAHHA